MKKWTLLTKTDHAELWFNNQTKRYSIWFEGTLLEYLTFSDKKDEKAAREYFSTFKWNILDMFEKYDFEQIRLENIDHSELKCCTDFKLEPIEDVVGYSYFNPNVRGAITGDCVKRAICVAANIEYKQLENFMNSHKVKKDLAYNYLPNYEHVIALLGGLTIKMSVPAGRARWHVSTINKVMHNYPHISYVLSVSKHRIGVRNETIFDLYDDRQRDKGIYKMYIFGATAKERAEIQAKCGLGDDKRFSL